MLGIYLAKVLHTPDGMLMEYREVIRLAERAFGVKISNHRELKRDIFKRTNELVILNRNGIRKMLDRGRRGKSFLPRL